MLSKLFITIFILSVIFYSCQKDIQRQPVSFNLVNNETANKGVVDPTGRWYGTYVDSHHDPDDTDIVPDTVSEASLIHNGQASCNILQPPLDDYLLSGVGYYMPADKKIPGDSITFIVTVTDDVNVVQLDIVGKYHTAHAVCEKNMDGTSSAITLSVGKSHTTAVIQPAINFAAFKRVSLMIKEKKAIFQIGNQGKTTLTFKIADKIGNIKMLSAGYHELPSIHSPINRQLACAGVQLQNSYNQQPVMKETFSINGKSHTIFY